MGDTEGVSVSQPRVVVRDDPHAFRIRAARRGDARGVSKLIEDMGYPHGTDAVTVHWMVSHPETEIFIAADPGDRPIGLVLLTHRPSLRAGGRIAMIDELVVTPAWRMRGVGKALLEHAMDRARTLSVRRLDYCHAEELGDVPRAFLESCGMSPTDGAIYRVRDLDFCDTK